MGTVTKTVGTNGRNYSTITLWEADTDNAAVYAAGDLARGECYNDSAFSENFTVNGGGTVGLVSITLTAAIGQRHSGTAGTGVRIVNPAASGFGAWLTSDIPKEASWLEVDANGKPPASGALFLSSNSAANVAKHNIVHGVNRASFGASSLIRLTNSAAGGVGYEQDIIGNVCYDYVHASGNILGAIYQSVGGTNITRILGNTCHDITNNSASGTSVGISAVGTATVTNNICTSLDGTSSGSKTCFGVSTATNLSSDATGTVINKSAANQYVSTVAGFEDLHLKTGADAIDAGTDLGTTPTGVNISMPETGYANGYDRDADPDGRAATWDIGAFEAAPPAATGFTQLLKTSQLGQDLFRGMIG